MAVKKLSRTYLIFSVLVLVAASLAYAFWPRAVLVDLAAVQRGPMIVTINEEARTRVHDQFVLSTPSAGQLLRVHVQPGDQVVRGETVVARMLPTPPSVLDVRTKEQARANVEAAEAALRVARADVNKATADQELANADLERAQSLSTSGIISQAALERAERTARAAGATVETSRAGVEMRLAELENAQAYLIGFEDKGLASAIGNQQEDTINLTAPADGRILQVLQQSETTLPAGTPILEIGDTANDLEVVVELLSTDAVQVQPGMKVIIDNWGGSKTLEGEISRVDSSGFTKFSALGVEEQRVNAIVRLLSPPEDRPTLGHGFRVEARIVIWQKPDAMIVPTGALFREDEGWAVFKVVDGIASVHKLEIEANNGIEAAIRDGLKVGDTIVLYPSSTIASGTRVSQRPTE